MSEQNSDNINADSPQKSAVATEQDSVANPESAPSEAINDEAVNAETPPIQLASLSDAAKIAGVATVIEKPDANVTDVISLVGKKNLQFAFDLNDVRVEIENVDLIITFDDGSKIILLDFGLQMASDEQIILAFDDLEVSTDILFSKVGEYNSIEVHSANFTSSEATDQGGQTGDNDELVEIVEVKKGDFETKSPFEGFKGGAGISEEEAFSSKVNEKVADFEEESETPSSAPPAAADGVTLPVSLVEIDLLGVHGQTSEILDDGTNLIRSQAAVAKAVTDVSYSVQAQVESISGTAGKDIIYADDDLSMPEGTSVRRLEITVTTPDGGWTPTEVTISGLPAGYHINNAIAQDGGTYTLLPDADNPDLLVVELRYTIPKEGTVVDASGFLDQFTLNLVYSVTNETHSVTSSTSATARFGIREVNNAQDAAFIDEATDEPVFVLWSNPPGTNVTAGAGDDTVYAGIGADTLNGGAGTDTLSYQMSHEAVSINLATKFAEGGYAKDDVISNFENLEGSHYDDKLTGDTGDNVIIGGKGADVIDGGAGNDTVSFEKSELGVKVDLANGTGGNAADASTDAVAAADSFGDSYVNVENIIGSEHDDVLIGDDNDNKILGGDGDDVISGGLGADIIEGG